jgi:hypothetical protein
MASFEHGTKRRQCDVVADHVMADASEQHANQRTRQPSNAIFEYDTSVDSLQYAATSASLY